MISYLYDSCVSHEIDNCYLYVYHEMQINPENTNMFAFINKENKRKTS